MRVDLNHRTLRFDDLPDSADGCCNLPGSLWVDVRLAQMPSTNKALSLDHVVLPAIVRAVNAFDAMVEAIELIHSNAAESVEWIRRHTSKALAAAKGVSNAKA